MNLGDNGVTYISLPPNFQTEENDALGYAVDRQLKKLMEAADIVAVWINPGNVPEKYYNYMAASIRTPYYASQYDASTRLGILESAFQVYMFAGTWKGVEELVGKVFSGKAVFQPWYEYNGEPYHFRISVYGSPIRDTLKKFREILKRVKSKRSVLDVIEYIIALIISMPEEMDITKISMRTQISFWGCRLANGSKLVDGSALLDAKRRYDLILGIINGIKVYTRETMDIDRMNIDILSCFNVYEKAYAATLFNLGKFNLNKEYNYKLVLKAKNNIKINIKETMNTDGMYINILSCFNTSEKAYAATLFNLGSFYFDTDNKMPLKIKVSLSARVKQDIDAKHLVNGSIKAYTKEKINTTESVKAVINQKSTAIIKTKHKAAVKTSWKEENFTVTYRRNLHYFDGSGRFDGSSLFNAFYKKEEL